MRFNISMNKILGIIIFESFQYLMYEYTYAFDIEFFITVIDLGIMDELIIIRLIYYSFRSPKILINYKMHDSFS